MQTSQNINLFSPEEIHLSLVRGHYVLRHHQIQLFVDELNKKLSKISPFSLCLSTIRLFENDERTRCFICLCDYAENTFSDSHLSSKKVIKDIEDTLNLFGPKVKIPKAQDDGEDPDNFVFHTSIGWCLPDHKAEAIELVDRLNVSSKIISTFFPTTATICCDVLYLWFILPSFFLSFSLHPHPGCT